MVVLDVTIVNIALPHIQSALHFSTTGLAWVVSAYTLTFGGLLLLGGRTGDILGRRRVFMCGVLLFALASLLGGLSQSSGQLLAARALQGVGGAIASPTALALITTTFTEGLERNRAFGVFAAVSAGGGAIGLLAGGVLVEWLDWRWVLFVNVPIAALILLATPRHIKESERHAGHFDLAGALTSTLGMVALVYGFIRAAQEGWRDPFTLASFAAAVVLLASFVLVERRSQQPITPLHMFADRNRAGTYGIMLSLAASIFGMFFFLTLFVQDVLGFTPLRAGLAFLPVSAIIAVGAGLASRLLPRYGPKPFMVTGALLAAAGLVLAHPDRRPLHLRGQHPRPDPRLRTRHGSELRLADPDGRLRCRPRTRRARPPACSTPPSRWAVHSACPSWSRCSAPPAGTRRPTRFPASSARRTRLSGSCSGAPAPLPRPWSDQVLTSGVSTAFVVATIFALVAALIAVFAIQVRPSDLERLQGARRPAVEGPVAFRGGISGPCPPDGG